MVRGNTLRSVLGAALAMQITVLSWSTALAQSPSDVVGTWTLVFKVDSATLPNWNETEQKRLLASGNRDELRYVTPTASSGGVGTVTWKHAK